MFVDGILFADVVVAGKVKRQCPCGSVLKATANSALRKHLGTVKHGRWAVANLPALLAAAPKPIVVVARPVPQPDNRFQIECGICFENKVASGFYNCPTCRNGHCFHCNKGIRRGQVKRCPFCRVALSAVGVNIFPRAQRPPAPVQRPFLVDEEMVARALVGLTMAWEQRLNRWR